MIATPHTSGWITHRRLLQITVGCWVVFAVLFLWVNGAHVITDHRDLFAAAMLAPVFPLVMLPGALAGGSLGAASALVALQAVEVVPWLAATRTGSRARMIAALAGIAIYWAVVFAHV